MLAQFEIYFGRSIYKDKNGNFEVKKTNGKIIRDRFVKSEGLLLLFHPEFCDGKFRPIRKMIKECRETIEKEKDVEDKEDKFKFLDGLTAIIKDFVDEEKPMQKAMHDFDTILANQADDDLKHHINILRRERFPQNINYTLAEHYTEQTKCFSGVMTNEDLVKFWSDENSLNKADLGPKPLALFKYVIRTFLGEDLN